MMKKRHKRGKKILMWFLIFVFILAVLAVIVVEVFQVKKVVVSGNELYTDEQIQKSVLNDKYSGNSLYVFFKYKLFRMKEVPFIDEMEISLQSPQILKINVYEKAIIGYLETDNQNIYFDKDGFVVEISKKTIPDVPRIDGLECKNAIVYEKLDIDNDALLTDILALSQQLRKYHLVPDAILCSSSTELTADYGDIQVLVGSSDYLVEKMMRLDSIFPEIKGKKGVLHLENWTPMTSDIIFDPVEEKKTKKKDKDKDRTDKSESE